MTADSMTQTRDAYLQMARVVGYRPCAPSDGLGTITVPLDQLDITREASAYATGWRVEEDRGAYEVGSPDYPDRPALIYVIEAARLLCGTDHRRAAQLLRLAADDIDARVR